MTRSEFIEAYMARSSRLMTGDTATGVMAASSSSHPSYVALPCGCGEPGCHGWAKVRNDPESIEDHQTLYSLPGGRSL